MILMMVMLLASRNPDCLPPIFEPHPRSAEEIQREQRMEERKYDPNYKDDKERADSPFYAIMKPVYPFPEIDEQEFRIAKS